jgi:hypothetical protein
MYELIYSKKAIESFTEDFYAPRKEGVIDINSFRFRSDEFTNIHDGKHIVFSGCSNTFGIGIERNEGWAWKTYEKITQKEKCSGFFNLGAGGTGIAHMVINVFKYCKKYGNPEVIFMNLSNQNRAFHYLKELNGYSLKFNDEDSYNDTKLYNYQYYFMLEQYCRSNNIQLYSFTWDTDGYVNVKNSDKIIKETTNYLFKEYKFKTFYYYPFEDMLNNLHSLQIKTKDKYFLTARDGQHQGTGYNTIWSNFIYDKYAKDNYDKKD